MNSLFKKAKFPIRPRCLILRLIQCLAFGALLNFASAMAGETKTNGANSTSAGGASSASCGGGTHKYGRADVQQFTNEVFPSDQAKADCYMKLFDAETGSNPDCQQEGVPNPPGMGLCTLEGNPTDRKWRGGACAVDNSQLNGDTEDGVKQQIKCCAHILAGMNGGQYFDPIKKNKVPNCELP